MKKEQDASQEEQWNMAKAYLMRIDQLLTACDHHQMSQNGEGWYQTLFALYKELYPKLKEKEKWQAEVLLNKLRYARSHPTKEGTQTRGQVIVKVNSEPFVNFELFLRTMLEEKKLLTPKGADPTKSYRGG